VALACLFTSIKQPGGQAIAPQTRWAKLPDMVRHGDDLSALYQMAYALFLPEFQQQLLGDTDAASMVASIEVQLPLVDQVLLEAIDRLPVADRYHSLRAKCMLGRIGLRGLDPALFERPKSGFVLPYDHWLRSDLGKMIDGTLLDADAIRPTGLNSAAVLQLVAGLPKWPSSLYWSRVWALYVFIRWCHRHGAYL
jgi:asparagine synthase (glutamine-hydrolysing)